MAERPEREEVGADRAQHGLPRREVFLACADHDGERGGPRAAHAPADGRVDQADAARRRARGEAAGGLRAHRAEIEDDVAVLRPGEEPGRTRRAEDHGLDDALVRQREQRHARPARQRGKIGRARGAQALELGRGLRALVVDRHRVAGFQDVGGHGSAHVAGADESDVHGVADSGAGAPVQGQAFFIAAGRRGQVLWYHVEPSLTWLPFLLIFSLHFGHVPIERSLS